MRFWLIVVGLLVLTCAGCGGGGKPAGKVGGGQAGAALGPANAAQANPVAAPGGANALPAPRPIASADKSKPEGAATTGGPEAEEPVPAGPDDFEINSDVTTTEIAGTFREPLPPPVDVIKPTNGRDSNTLEIVIAEATRPTNPDSVAAPAAPGAAIQAVVETTSADGGGWQLPTGATAVAGSETHPETGLPLKITLERDPVEMVLVPPGVFLEGIEGRDSNAAPQHAVLLEAPYYIDVVEVTVARHDAFREALRKSDGRRMEPSLNHDGNPEAPAVGIKFLDAKFYAKWAGKELPTEAQWERAARGGQGHEFPWGNGRPIWHQARHPGQLDSVALHPGDRSPFGVFDMAGNAREWCLDIYHPDTFQKDVAAGGEPVRNPAGPKAAQTVKLQVVKGGKTDWAVWHRAGQPQNEAGAEIGFRCVLNVSDATADTEKPKSKSSLKASEKNSDKKASGGRKPPD